MRPTLAWGIETKQGRTLPVTEVIKGYLNPIMDWGEKIVRVEIRKVAPRRSPTKAKKRRKP